MSAYLGIEFGSTRIKAVLADENGEVLAIGSRDWENLELPGGVWSYRLEDAIAGMRDAFVSLKVDRAKRGHSGRLRVDALGVSGMMHGYLPFDREGKQLADFRTWRCTLCGEASERLSAEFGFPIPQRWSVAHLYERAMAGAPELASLAFLTTLAGHVHFRLTGVKALGIGEASGMFPIDPATGDYDATMLAKLDALLAPRGYPWKTADVLPRVLRAGVEAGRLTGEGALLIDPSGELEPGCPVAPPEGDVQTGMVATDSVAPGSMNVSAGTSVFGTLVLERPLRRMYPEIDVVMSPCGHQSAMSHANTCTSDINAWASLFAEVRGAKGGDILEELFRVSEKAEPDCGGVVAVPFVSGEPVVHLDEGRPFVMRESGAEFTLANFMRASVYSAFATMVIGVELIRGEGLSIDLVTAHGGIFRTKGVAQRCLADALGAKVKCLSTAGEGGAWGMAILAAFATGRFGDDLGAYLSRRIFKGAKGSVIRPSAAGMRGFAKYLASFRRALGAVPSLTGEPSSGAKKTDVAKRIAALKERVLAANLRLRDEGLVVLTWGNASEYDPGLGLVAIKPSGVDYSTMRADDIVVVDLEGDVVEGPLRPSSDTPTHLEIYRAFPGVRGVVHTHSPEATARAQTGREIPCYGTTHADAWHGPVPMVRMLTKRETTGDYERATGRAIVERFRGLDPISSPGALVHGHGPFTWGEDAMKAVDAAVTLESVARMARLTETISDLSRPAKRLPAHIAEKHHLRKHGDSAYYGQRKGKESCNTSEIANSVSRSAVSVSTVRTSSKRSRSARRRWSRS